MSFWILTIIFMCSITLLVAQFIATGEKGGDPWIAIASALAMFASGVLLLSL